MEHKNDIRDWTEERPRPVRPEELGDLLRRMQKDLITSEHPFADFKRERLRDKGILQQNAFLAADLSGDEYGGAVLLGLKAPVIIGHGATSPKAVKNGALVCAKAVRDGLVDKIAADIEAEE